MKAWVYPGWGDDATGALNDPTQPYKSIQAAIDALFAHLKASSPPNPATLQGLVWCMPGVYGPTSVHGSAASGDTFPIMMRHRVNVRGVGARRCIIRGVPTADPAHSSNSTHPVFWPVFNANCIFGTGPTPRQVLISYALTSQYEPDPVTYAHEPWAGKGEVAEILDGFTFQGGDIQVIFRKNSLETQPMAGRISNCVFDMRHMPAPAVPVVDGPYFGILMEKKFDYYNTGVCGYFDQKVNIVNNTFILAQFDGVWKNEARNGAVGIIDVTNPNSEFTSPYDSNLWNRGLGNATVQNNIFRTRPANVPTNTGRMAMLGVDAADTLVRDGTAGGQYVSTNAFAPGRVGSFSSLFHSVPVTSILVGYIDMSGGQANPPWLEPMYYDAPAADCDNLLTPYCAATPAALPTPAVPLWNGGPGPFNPQQVDPAFVGEYLVTLPPPNPVLSDYVDWRIVPGSPMIDQGRLWFSNQFQNGSLWNDLPEDPGSPCEELRLDRWDGESYGNVRKHGANVDIGADEFHLAVMAGSYANGDNSHNRTTVLNPSVAASQSERRVLLPTSAAEAPLLNNTLRIKGAERQAPLPIPPATYSGWNQPPQTLASPLVHPSLPAGFQTEYINTSVERWTATLSSTVQWTNPMGVPNWSPWSFFRVALPADDEGPNFYSWFNTQPLIDFTAPALPDLWGNLQAEYR